MKAYLPSCHTRKKRRHRQGYLNLQTTDTTRSSESIWRQQSSGLSWTSRDCTKQEERHKMLATLQRGLTEMMASAHAASFQSLTLCGSVHMLVNCRVSVPMVKTAHACEVWCPPGPGSRGDFGAENGFTTALLCAPWQLWSRGGSRLCCTGPWWKRCSLQVCHCPGCTNHFSVEGWDLSPPANHRVMLSHTDGPGKSHWGNLCGKSHSGSLLGISGVLLGIRCHH